MTSSVNNPQTREQTRVLFNQAYDPNERRYEVNENSTALVRYAPDFRTDPFYHKVLQHMQMGEWQQAVMLLNALTDKYPKALELTWLLQDAGVRAEVEQNWGDKVKGRSDTFVNVIPTLARVAAVVLILILLAGAGWAFLRFRQNSAVAAERLALLNQAQTAMNDANYEDAIKFFDQLLVSDPQDTQAVNGKAEAEKQLALAAKYDQAIAALDGGKNEEGLSLLTELQTLSPGYKDVTQRIEQAQARVKAAKLFVQAEASYAAQEWQTAVAQYEELRAADSTYESDTVVDRTAEIYLLLGQQAVSQRPISPDELTGIQEYFRKVLRLKTGDETARTESDLLDKYLLGARSLTQGNLEQAVSNLKEVYDTRPQYLGGLLVDQLYTTLLALGDRAQTGGDYQSALNYYREAMNLPVADKSLAVRNVTKVSVAMAPTPTPTPEPTATPQPASGPSSAYAGGGGGGGDESGLGFAIADKPLSAYKGWLLFERDGSYYIMKTDGSSQMIAPAEAGEKYDQLYNKREWSPDGKNQAYVGKNWDGSDKADIWKFRADLPENWRRNFEMRTAPGLQYDPAWSPRNDLVAFVSNETGNDEIWIMDLEGKNARQLTKNSWEWDKHPTWTADGSRLIFFSNRTGKAQIWSMNPDGSDPINISKSEFNDQDPVLIR
ncbi:MAG: tetratricopeptide repeat protein [Caldilineaceae bacterium]